MNDTTDLYTVTVHLHPQVQFRDGKPDSITVGDRTIWIADRGTMDPAMSRVLADLVTSAASVV